MKNLLSILFISAFSILMNTSISNGHSVGHDHKDHKKNIKQSLEDKQIESYKNKAKNGPQDYYNYLKLGELYIQKGREEGSIDKYKKAEAALMNALELNPDDYRIYLGISRIRSYGHNFRGALEYVDKAIELRPDKSVTYAIKGDAHLELGEYDKALNAYAFLHYLEPGFDSYTRVSRIRFLTGDTEGAIRAMKQAIELSRRQTLHEENLAWAEVMLGELYFMSAGFEKAQVHYLNALELFRDYYLALGHLGELFYHKGELEKAASYYRRAIDINPKPEYYLALGDVYTELGDASSSERYYRIGEKKYHELVKAGIKGHSRELVLHYVDNNIKLDKALELALADSMDTEDIYAYDTLAWVYYKLGDLENAEYAIKKAVRLGTRDGVLYYHEEMIHNGRTKHGKAKDYPILLKSKNPRKYPERAKSKAP